MKFGACIELRLSNYEKAKSYIDNGFDFLETNMAGIYQMTDEEADTLAKRMAEDGVHLHSANCMFPGWIFENGIELLGENASIEWQNEFLDKVYPRCQKLGMKTIVFGSGKQRRIPDGMDLKEAHEAHLELCRRISDKAKPYGITIVLEPLNYTETNCFNTVEEGYNFVKEVNRDNFKLLSDVYHMYRNEEEATLPEAYVKEMHHIHVPQPGSRFYPTRKTPYLTEYARSLKANGFDGYAAVEANGNLSGIESDVLTLLKEIF